MTKTNQLMVFSPWCVLQVNEVTIVGYALSWILGSSLKATEFLAVAPKYPSPNCLHLGLQHQFLLDVVLSL
jgi:hypothetical protein